MRAADVRRQGKFPRQRWIRLFCVGVLGLVPLWAAAMSMSLASRPQEQMFSDIATPDLADGVSRAEGACWGDVNGDHRDDLFVTNSDGSSRLWRNDGEGRFTDISVRAGILSVQRAVGCTLLDLDNDGNVDLFVTAKNHFGDSPSDNMLLRNNGNGTFTDVSSTARVSMRGVGVLSSDWADVDGDGDYDGFIAARYRGAERRLRRNGLFQQVDPLVFRNIAATKGLADPIGPQTAHLGTWIDYDADGDLDLLVALDYWGVELFRNDAGEFTRVTTRAFPPAHDETPGAPPNNPMGVAWGDYNNDGCLDVFVSGTNTFGQGGFGADVLGDLASRLYRNNCDGTFADVTKAAGFMPTGVIEWAANFVDFDNDGDIDLSVVAGNPSETIKGTRGFVKRFFKPPVTALVTIARKVLLTILPNAVRLSEAAYRYEMMVPAIGAKGVAAAMPKFLYRNLLVETGTATFVNANDLLSPLDFGATLGSAWADLDGDGDLDWFVPNRGTPNRLYRNNGVGGHFLRVHLIGHPLKAAVGAWVKIRAAGRWQVRHVHVLDGFLSQSQLDPHFGLGPTSAVDEIQVRWPGTATWVTACTNVPADRTVTVRRVGGCGW